MCLPLTLRTLHQKDIHPAEDGNHAPGKLQTQTCSDTDSTEWIKLMRQKWSLFAFGFHVTPSLTLDPLKAKIQLSICMQRLQKTLSTRTGAPSCKTTSVWVFFFQMTYYSILTAWWRPKTKKDVHIPQKTRQLSFQSVAFFIIFFFCIFFLGSDHDTGA